MQNWFSRACIVQAVHAGSLYVNTTISKLSVQQLSGQTVTTSSETRSVPESQPEKDGSVVHFRFGPKVSGSGSDLGRFHFRKSDPVRLFPGNSGKSKKFKYTWLIQISRMTC